MHTTTYPIKANRHRRFSGLSRLIANWPSHLIVAVSAGCNAWFGFEQGINLITSLIYCGCFLAFDYAKPRAMKRLFEAFANREWHLAAISAVIVFALVGMSALSAIGFSSMVRSEKTGSAENKISSYDRTLAEYNSAKQKLEVIGAVRAVNVVNAEIGPQAVQHKSAAWIWKASNECNDPKYSKACTPITKLRTELAQAKEAEKQQKRMDEAKIAMDTMKRPASKDAQAENLSRATGLDMTRIQTAIVLFTAATIEIVAAFAYVISGAPARTICPQVSPVPQQTIHAPISRQAQVPALTPRISIDSETDLLHLLRTSVGVGGTYRTTQAALGAVFGNSKSTINGLLHNLAGEGLIDLSTSPRGTSITVLA